MHGKYSTCLIACKSSIICGASMMYLPRCSFSLNYYGAGRPGGSAGAGGQRSTTTPEKALKGMLDKTGLNSDSEAEAGSNEAAEDDDDEDDDEPDLDALATRLSAKVGWLHLKLALQLGWARHAPLEDTWLAQVVCAIVCNRISLCAVQCATCRILLVVSYCVSCGSMPLQTGQARSRSATPSAGDAVKRSTAANKRKADAQPADAAKRVGCCASNILWIHQSASSIREHWLSSGKAKQGCTTREQSRAGHPCSLAPCLTCILVYAQAKTRGCFKKPFDPLAGKV